MRLVILAFEGVIGDIGEGRQSLRGLLVFSGRLYKHQLFVIFHIISHMALTTLNIGLI